MAEAQDALKKTLVVFIAEQKHVILLTQAEEAGHTWAARPCRRRWNHIDTSRQ